MTHHHDPLLCILPPQILERIVLNGDGGQREAALKTLARDQSLRAARAQNSLRRAPSAAPRVNPHLAEPGAASRAIFDCQGTEDTSRARMVRSEGDSATGDVAVDEAYEGLGATYQLYWEAFERNSIDDEGAKLFGFVHYGENYDNAFWDGRQMVFGDGDGQLINRFTIAIDIIGHELTHGVVEDEAGLVYFQQPGALNEHIADVGGSLVKQYALKQQAEEADWLIGAGLILDSPGQALRSMKAPGTAYDHPVLGKDNQPSHMDQYVQTTSDNGGVHANSGIPNKAFYLAATNIGGYAWETAGRIWYEALRDTRLGQTARFRTFARLTLRAADRLGFGPSSAEYRAVQQAWSDVGLAV